MEAHEARHVVAHTSRILRALEDRPDHPRKAEYDKQLRVYRAQWAALEPDDREAVAASLVSDAEAEDLTDETVGAAVAALEANPS
jgi:hypothetical protein